MQTAHAIPRRVKKLSRLHAIPTRKAPNRHRRKQKKKTRSDDWIDAIAVCSRIWKDLWSRFSQLLSSVGRASASAAADCLRLTDLSWAAWAVWTAATAPPHEHSQTLSGIQEANTVTSHTLSFTHPMSPVPCSLFPQLQAMGGAT